MPTRLTGEDGLAPTIAPCDMSARTALLARIRGVHQGHRDASQPRLVFDEAAELEEGPAGHTSPLRLPERSPTLANTLKVFEGNPPHGVCSSRNEPFTDDVIDITAKGRFSSGRALQGTTDVLGPLPVQVTTMCRLLQALSAPRISRTARFHGVSGMRLGIAGCRQMDHAEIDADEIRHRQACAIWKRHRHQQKPQTIPAQHQIDLPMGKPKALALVGTHEERHNDPACQRRDTDRVWSLEADILAHGKGHRGMTAKGWRTALVPFVGFHDLGNAPYRGIRRQSKTFPHLVVGELLQRDLIGALVLQGDTCQPGCGLIEAFNEGLQGVRLCSIGEQLELQGQLHVNEYIGYMNQCQMPIALAAGIEPQTAQRAIPLPAEAGSPLARISGGPVGA